MNKEYHVYPREDKPDDFIVSIEPPADENLILSIPIKGTVYRFHAMNQTQIGDIVGNRLDELITKTDRKQSHSGICEYCGSLAGINYVELYESDEFVVFANFYCPRCGYQWDEGIAEYPIPPQIKKKNKSGNPESPACPTCQQASIKDDTVEFSMTIKTAYTCPQGHEWFDEQKHVLLNYKSTNMNNEIKKSRIAIIPDEQGFKFDNGERFHHLTPVYMHTVRITPDDVDSDISHPFEIEFTFHDMTIDEAKRIAGSNDLYQRFRAVDIPDHECDVCGNPYPEIDENDSIDFEGRWINLETSIECEICGNCWDADLSYYLTSSYRLDEPERESDE